MTLTVLALATLVGAAVVAALATLRPQPKLVPVRIRTRNHRR